jgi:single-strand DNA-binding protein
MNSCSFIGRIGKDPEVKTISSGKSVCNFSLAIRDRGGESFWLEFVAWEKSAELLRDYVTKGQQVGVNARCTVRKYIDRDQVERRQTEFVVNDITLIGGKQDGHSTAPARPGQGQQQGRQQSGPPPRQPKKHEPEPDLGWADDVGMDDIPF